MWIVICYFCYLFGKSDNYTWTSSYVRLSFGGCSSEKYGISNNRTFDLIYNTNCMETMFGQNI